MSRSKDLLESAGSATLSPSRRWVVYSDPVVALDSPINVHVRALTRGHGFELGRVTSQSWLPTSDILWFRRDADTIIRLDVEKRDELRIRRPDDDWSFLAVAGLTEGEAAVVELRRDHAAQRFCVISEEAIDRCTELPERGSFDVHSLDSTHVVLTRFDENEGTEIRVVEAEALVTEGIVHLPPEPIFVAMAQAGAESLILSYDQTDRLTFTSYREGVQDAEVVVEAAAACGIPHLSALPVRAATIARRDGAWSVVLALPLESRWREYRLRGEQIDCVPFAMIN
jgi:hypothetical protein